MLGTLITCLILAAPCYSREPTYDLEVINIKVQSINPDYITPNSTIRIVKFNDTTPAFELDFCLLRDLPNDTLVSFKGYEKIGCSGSAQYQQSLIDFENILLSETMKGGPYQSMVKHGNLPPTMPFTEKCYFVKKYTVDESQLPPFIPGECWRLVVLVSLQDDTVLFQVDVYFRLHQRAHLGVKG